jgi:hypothetical protein
LDAKDKEAIARVLADEGLFVRHCLSIIDKSGKLVRFAPNRPQRLFEERSAGHRFVYIIKGRKMVISSRIIAGDLWACATLPNQHAICLTQTGEDAAKMISDRIKPMLRNAAIPLGGVERGDHILFPATNSKYYIGTAGARKFGRGSDITRYHMSEFAHWSDPEVLTAVEEACTDNAIGRIETTANGYNHAQTLWAESKLGKTRYHPIFMPWYADESYSLAGAKIDVVTEDELELVEAYNLNHEQIAWRRAKRRDMSRPDLFPQEYPSNDIEAFVSSGRPVFDWLSLQRHEQRCDAPRWIGDVRDDGKRVSFVPSDRGSLKIWKTPDAGHVYVIGADVAEGLEDGAYSVAEVIDIGTDEQVGEWHGHIAPDLFGDVLIDIGRYYNNALLAPEAWPGPGEVTEVAIKERGYSNVYRDPENDRGWRTDRHSKQRACLGLAAAVRDLKISLRSKDLLAEMRSFMYTPAGGMDPASGSYSDRIMALAIAWQVAQTKSAYVNYDSPRLRDILTPSGLPGGVTMPHWRGKVMGVRHD